MIPLSVNGLLGWNAMGAAGGVNPTYAYQKFEDHNTVWLLWTHANVRTMLVRNVLAHLDVS